MVCTKRLCWSCEADIDMELSRCPYCGVATDEREETDEAFAPPYQLHGRPERHGDIHSPPYEGEEGRDREHWEDRIDPKVTDELHRQCSHSIASECQPLLLLLSGAVFFIFGAVLFLYRKQGALTLEWDTGLWPFFLLPSLALLYLGWQRLQTLEESFEPEEEQA